MSRNAMLNAIVATLHPGETILVTVTEARGRTHGLDYVLTAAGYSLHAHRWSRPGAYVAGTLRSTYRERVLSR